MKSLYRKRDIHGFRRHSLNFGARQNHKERHHKETVGRVIPLARELLNRRESSIASATR
jgi:hypothetical protein